MVILLISCLLVSIASYAECRSDYEYSPTVGGWFKEYKVFANWSEASFQCFDDGAVLASPTSTQIKHEMVNRIRSQPNGRQSYFIGVHSRFSPGHFVSIEGIPLDNMPVTDMIERLYLNAEECLSTDGNKITMTSCASLLPYMCYRKKDQNLLTTSCGTFDEDYELEPTTGSCYKLHKDLRTWEEANSVCISEGGYLVILNNEKEARLIYNMFPKGDLNTTHSWGRWSDPLFIGLRDWGNGVWRSIHGEPIEHLYRDWRENEPSKGEQFCAAIVRGNRLDNVYCDVVGFFVCERDPENIRFKE